MELAYLGLFEKVFNWVLNKIFDPIFKWLSSLLNTVFTWIFEEILSPILLPILEKAFEFGYNLWIQIYGTIVYSLFAGILKLIDYMETAFDVFIGIRNVKYYPNGSGTGSYIEGSLVEILLQQKTVSTIFWLLTAAGLSIALLLTIFATAKSAFDLDFENKRPVSKVLTAMMKTFIQFFTVPFFVYFMLKLSAIILKIVSTAVTGDISTTLGRIVFVVASLNAAKTSGYNANDNPDFVLGTSSSDKSRYPFYIMNAQEGVTPKDYADIEAVKNVFDVTKFDYLIGILAAGFLLFVMAVCLITFVQRIFEIILLYIVSPYFVSTMPLDDGERFGRWRDMFIGKCFTGFGSAIGMRLYLLVCRMIMGNEIRFSEARLGSSIEMDYMMKLFFLIGGAWAVFKSGPTITSLINAGAGQQEGMTQGMIGGALYGHTIGTAMSAGKGALMSAFRGKSGERALSRKKNAMNSDPSQKFDGSKGDRMAKAGVSKAGMAKNGVAKAGMKKPAGVTVGAANAQKRTSVSSGAGGNIAVGANRKTQTAGASNKSAMTGGKAASGAGVTVKPGRLAMSKEPGMMQAAKAVAAEKNFGKTPETSSAYKEKKNFQIGSLIQSTYDDNGNHKVRVFGFGVDKDASGKTMAFKMPIMNMKLQRAGEGQGMKLARLNVPGIVKINSNVQNGKLKYSDISVLHGMGSYHSSESGSGVSILGGLGQYSRDEEGTHKGFIGFQKHQFADGSKGFDAGNFSYRRNEHGKTITAGNLISINSSQGRYDSIKIGAIKYNRSGVVTKETAGKNGK